MEVTCCTGTAATAQRRVVGPCLLRYGREEARGWGRYADEEDEEEEGEVWTQIRVFHGQK